MAADERDQKAREAVLDAIIKSAPKVRDSPAGIRQLAEAYSLVEGGSQPDVEVNRKKK